jgi:hypothetical protein
VFLSHASAVLTVASSTIAARPPTIAASNLVFASPLIDAYNRVTFCTGVNVLAVVYNWKSLMKVMIDSLEVYPAKVGGTCDMSSSCRSGVSCCSNNSAK